MQYVRPEDPSKFHAFLVELFTRYPSLRTSREAAILLANLQWLIPDFVKGVLLEWEGHKASLVQQARGGYCHANFCSAIVGLEAAA